MRFLPLSGESRAAFLSFSGCTVMPAIFVGSCFVRLLAGGLESFAAEYLCVQRFQEVRASGLQGLVSCADRRL